MPKPFHPAELLARIRVWLLTRELDLVALDLAMVLGRPGGRARVPVDRDPALVRLRATLPPRDDTEECVDCLPTGGVPPSARRAPPVPHREAMLPDLTEPLTARELEVLNLLARRLSNKEIATSLCVSWQTVAKHTNNLYQKFRVASRRDAVARAEALGILPAARSLAVDA